MVRLEIAAHRSALPAGGENADGNHRDEVAQQTSKSEVPNTIGNLSERAPANQDDF